MANERFTVTIIPREDRLKLGHCDAASKKELMRLARAMTKASDSFIDTIEVTLEGRKSTIWTRPFIIFLGGWNEAICQRTFNR